MKAVFLFSLPRSGSTLLQRILGSHPQIHTLAEPWILLPLLYPLRERGMYCEYGHDVAREALLDFCQALVGGRSCYDEQARRTAMELYERASPEGTRYFLDKTPRYALIAHEILSLFPDARFICLWRNPLAVVDSMMRTWHGGRWAGYAHKVDLYGGLATLVDAVRENSEKFHVLKYEDLVTEPHACARAVCQYLDIEYADSMVDRLSEAQIVGGKGDHVGSRAYGQVEAVRADAWPEGMRGLLRRTWCGQYLRWIGAERLAFMGYEASAIRKALLAPTPTLRGFAGDFVRMAYGGAYCSLELNMLRHKRRHRGGFRFVYGHS